jgi:uncharacterized membrane protein YgaE (UPF0421/DUF939 family)
MTGKDRNQKTDHTKTRIEENHPEIEGHAVEVENRTEAQHLTDQIQPTTTGTNHLTRIGRQAETVTDENDPTAQTDAQEKEHLQIIDRQEKDHDIRANPAHMTIHQKVQTTTDQNQEAAIIQTAQEIDQIPGTDIQVDQAIDHIQTIETEEAEHLIAKTIQDQTHHIKIRLSYPD